MADRMEHLGDSSEPKSSRFVLSTSLHRVASDAYLRSYTIATNIHSAVFTALALVPKTQAAPAPKPGYDLIEPPDSSYLEFTASPSNETTVIADAIYFADRGIQFPAWRARAAAIRRSGDFRMCTGNLSLALSQVGAAYQTSSNGSTNLLALLPTAGTLIGAPAKELWALYELIPLAGFLSIALSLGGNIIPQQVSDYTTLEDFSYKGMKSSPKRPDALRRRRTASSSNLNLSEDTLKAAENFADEVHARAMDHTGGTNRRLKIMAGMTVLCCCVASVIAACWLLQTGSIIVWWCTVSCSYPSLLRIYSLS